MPLSLLLATSKPPFEAAQHSFSTKCDIDESNTLSLGYGLRYTPIDTDLMNHLMDQGIIPDEPYFKESEAMSKQFDPEHIVDLTMSFKLNKAKVSHTFALEGLNILMTESGFGQRFLLREREVRVEKAGIALPNIFYRIDF